MRKIFTYVVAILLLVIYTASYAQTCKDTIIATYNNPNKGFSNCSFVSADTGFVFESASNALWKTTDGGLTWDSVGTSPTTGAFYQLFFLNSNDGFILNDSLYATTNGGKSWHVALHTTHPVSFTIMNFINKTTGYALGYGGIIYKTTDKGITWDSLSTISYRGHVGNMVFAAVDTGYISLSRAVTATTGETVVYGTTNGGKTWDTLYASSHDIVTMFFTDSKTGFMANNIYIPHSASYTAIYKTINAGQNWQQVYSSQTNKELGIIYSISFYTHQIGYATGAQGTILKTTDGGNTWATYKDTDSTYYISIAALGADKAIAVGGGTIAQLTCIEEVTAVVNPSTSNSFMVYPNPNTGSFTISCSNYNNYTVKIYNSLGQEVQTAEVASSETNIALGNTIQGIYYVTLEEGINRTTQKVIVE